MPRIRESRRGASGAVAVLAAVLTLVPLSSCGESASERAEEMGGVTARQVIESPSTYLGKTVTVTGTIDDVYGPRAFTLDSGLTIGELLVVGREPFPAVSEAGNRAFVVSDLATVTGTVRTLVTAEVEREIGWDLTPEIEAEYNAKPVLVAQSTAFKPGAGGRAAGNANTSAGAGSGEEIADVNVIVDAPDRGALVARRVRVTGVKVQAVPGDRVFYVGPSADRRLLVVLDEVKTPETPTEGRYDINAGQTVTFSGVVERVPSATEARRMFDGLIDDAEMNELLKEQVYVKTDRVDIVQR